MKSTQLAKEELVFRNFYQCIRVFEIDIKKIEKVSKNIIDDNFQKRIENMLCHAIWNEW